MSFGLGASIGSPYAETTTYLQLYSVSPVIPDLRARGGDEISCTIRFSPVFIWSFGHLVIWSSDLQIVEFDDK